MDTFLQLLFSGAFAIILSIPLMIWFLIYRFDSNRLQVVYVGVSSPQGQQQLAPLKTGPAGAVILWSLLMPMVGQLVLAFRNQFKEWLIWFLITITINMIIYFTNSTIVWDPNISFTENVNNLSAKQIILFTVQVLGIIIPMYWFSLTVNKSRIKKMVVAGYNIRNPYNDVSRIYKYLGLDENGIAKQKELPEGAVRGQTHDYVVPETENNDEDDSIDYSHLTIYDLKLLLKSEGIYFDPSSTKEELLELVNEHLVEEKVEVKKDESPYDRMTVAQLMEELDKKGISYKKNMKKSELRELLK